jgi:hypothetical protein
MGEVGLEPTRLSSPHFECGATVTPRGYNPDVLVIVIKV